MLTRSQVKTIITPSSPPVQSPVSFPVLQQNTCGSLPSPSPISCGYHRPSFPHMFVPAADTSNHSCYPKGCSTKGNRQSYSKSTILILPQIHSPSHISSCIAENLLPYPFLLCSLPNRSQRNSTSPQHIPVSQAPKPSDIHWEYTS